MIVSCFCIWHNHQKNLIETETKKTLDKEDTVKNCFHIVTKHFGAASTKAFLP